MDLVTGMSAVSQATGIAKDLRDAYRALDEASYKLRSAELQGLLADAQIAPAETSQGSAAMSSQIDDVEKEIVAVRSGDVCPVCRVGRMQLIAFQAVRKESVYRAGVQERCYRCNHDNCGFEDRRFHDPHGVLRG